MTTIGENYNGDARSARLNHDPARHAIDEALSAALGLPDLGPLREMLAREPGLTGKAAVGRPAGQQQ